MRKKYRHKGFTLLEILLTITLIGILATITLIAINPNRQLGQVRDLNRQKDITDIQQAVELYATRNSGVFPTGIEFGVYKEICGEIIDTSCVDLSILVPNYINSIPKDPSGNNYFIGINPNNNSISVWADNAEQAEIVTNSFILAAGAKDPSFDTGIPVGFNGESVSTTALQSDGKILVGGGFSSYQGVAANGIARLNSNGSIDTSFSIGTGFDNGVETLAIQSDGKIIVGGGFTSYNGVGVGQIIRLNTDGSRDTSFNMGVGFNNSDVNTLAIQSDGKIIVGGAFTSYNGVAVNRIARLNSNGSLDTSFSIGTGFNGNVNTLALQTDGKMLVGGSFTSYNGVEVNRIARLNSNGSIDTSFSIGTGFNNFVWTLALQNDGKILVGGAFWIYNGVGVNRIVRLNSDGTRDSSFNIGTGFSSDVDDIALQSDGKIVAGGLFGSYNGVEANRIIRLNSDGTRDSSFNMGTGFSGRVNGLSLQSDGKVIVGGGFSQYNGVSVNRIARLNSNGSLDTSFSIGTGFNDAIRSIDLQSDGKIIASGWFTSYNGVAANRILRLNTDGSRDTSFNIGTGFNGFVDRIDTAIQADGKILVWGDFTSYNGVAVNRIVRLNSNGSLDTGFNIGAGFNSNVNTLALQSDGKIIVGGLFSSYNGVAANRIIRLNSDGSRDFSFNIGTGLNNGVSTLALQSDGKILVGGSFDSYNGVATGQIIRLNTDGSMNPGLNAITSDSTVGESGSIRNLAIQSDGKILVSGIFTSYNGVESNGLIRINSDGTLDTSFNAIYSGGGEIMFQSNGKILVGGVIRLNNDGSIDNSFNIGTGFNNGGWVNTFAIQSDGKILLGGNFTIYQNQPAGYLIRIGN